MTRYPLLWFSQWYFNIALHPCQRLITLNGVDLVAFFLRQFHTGKTGFSIHHRGTPTDGPDAGPIAVCRCVVTFFSSRNWSRISGAGAPTAISARTAADRPYLIFAFHGYLSGFIGFCPRTGLSVPVSDLRL